VVQIFLCSVVNGLHNLVMGYFRLQARQGTTW
jgi:hypothetical protein